MKGPELVRFRDMSMIVVIILAVTTGLLLPQAAPYVEHVPFYSLMVSLYISFMPLKLRQIMITARSNVMGIVWFVITRHFLMPSIVYILFDLLAPEYALAALLIAGASTAVTAPFIAYLLEADVGFTTIMTVSSSFILPLSLPSIVLFWAGKAIDISAASMMFSLAQVILIPVIAVAITQRYLPRLATTVQRQGHFWGLLTMFLSVAAILSYFSDDIFSSPTVVLGALATASAVGVILAGLGWLSAFRLSPDARLTFVICSVLLNLVLVVVLCKEFFGLREAITAIMYTVPFYATIVPLRAYITAVARRKNH